MNLEEYLNRVGKSARTASYNISTANTGQKNSALLAAAEEIENNIPLILDENQKDLVFAEEKQLATALIDRLALNKSRVLSIIESLRHVALLDDPVGSIEQLNARPSGIQVGKMRVPIGVIGIIYESRPNVTIEAASLCLKSGNAAILRGGSEAFHSNQVLSKCFQRGLELADLDTSCVQIINTTDRGAVNAMINLPEYIDVIIPRGGKGLIEAISTGSRIPVIKHLDGVCHVFIDKDADFQQAIDITINAKTQRYGTCNTIETLLVSEAIYEQVLPSIFQRLAEKSVHIKACEKAISLASTITDLKTSPATEDDWSTEYLAPVLSVKVVPDLSSAIQHINQYGSGHTDAIITKDHQKAMKFLRAVDSSSVMINASTRFADGFEYGLGAEIGISTNKLHTRGPVGLEGLTTQKYVVLGDGHIRE